MRFRRLVWVCGVIWGVLLAFGTVAFASPHRTVLPAAQPGGGRPVIFADIDDDHWAAKYVIKAKLTSVIQGYADQTFRPDRLVTREEAIAMVIRTLGLEQKALNQAQGNQVLPYQDSVTISSWAKGYVVVARQMGLLDPNEVVLQPSTPASRLWLVEILVRALGYFSKDVSDASGTPLPFIDVAAIPPAERGYVAIAYGLGIIGGYPDNTFRPNNPVTRAETARLLDSFQNQLQQPVVAPVTSQAKGTNIVTGKVYAVSANALTVTFADNTSAVYAVSYGTYIFVNDRPAPITDIKPGYLVTIYLDGNGKAILVDAKLPAPKVLPPLPPVPGLQQLGLLQLNLGSSTFYSGEVVGTVGAVDGAQLTMAIYTPGGMRLDLQLAPWVEVEFPGDLYGTVDDLTAGDLVEVKVKQGVATKIEVKRSGSLTWGFGSWDTVAPAPPVYQGMPAPSLSSDYGRSLYPDMIKYKKHRKEKYHHDND